jgi:hypothetical protein
LLNAQTNSAIFRLARKRIAAVGSLPRAIILSQLVVAAAAIVIALWLFGWRRVSQRILTASMKKWLVWFPLLRRKFSIESLTPLVDMASGVFPRNRCLVRSLMLLWLLRANGLPAELLLGVRKRAGAFEAHAWTVSGGEVLGERPEAVAEFRTLSTIGKQ